MSTQVRPLSQLKRINPDLYKFLVKESPGISKKAQENEAYFLYCAISLRTPHGIEHITRDKFLYKTPLVKNNIATVTELGRLLMIGYCYTNKGLEEFTKKIAGYVYRAYHKKLSEGEAFNDTDYSELVKTIRENVGYYYTREDEAKLLLLERLFPQEIKPLLPPQPKELQEYNDIIELLKNSRANQRKKGIDYWIEDAEGREGYAYYLQEILDAIGYEYLSFEDWKKQEESLSEGETPHVDQYLKLKEEYRASIVNQVKEIDLL